MNNVHIAIVGGGPSGLISLYECKVRNIKATIFEKASQIGGVWNLDSGNGWAHRATVLNTSSFMNSYNLDFSLFNFLRNKYSKEYVDYATSTDHSEYLREFVDHYDLSSMIVLNTEVVDIISGQPGQRFTLKAVNVLNKEEKLHFFDYVIVASGLHGTPIAPSEPFLSSQLKLNEGPIWHTNLWDPLNPSSPCRKLMESKTVRILVTGGSYSASDAMLDSIIAAKNLGNYKNLKIYWAPTRTPDNRNVWYVSRYPFQGKKAQLPMDECINRISYMFPRFLFAKKVEEISVPLVVNVENEILNLNRDKFSFFQKERMEKALKDETIQIITEPILKIYRTDSSQVVFDTKSSKAIPVDIVVISSGYIQNQPKVNGKQIFKDSYRYQNIIPIDKAYSGRIGFICTVAIFGSMLSTTQMEVRWLMYQWFDKHSNLDKTLDVMRSKYSNKKNEKVLLDVLGPRLELLAKDMNICPSLWLNLFSLHYRPRHVALACIFGPWTIYQYTDLNETDSDRRKRENALLLSARNAYKKCGQSFTCVCIMSDMVYYVSLAAILSYFYMKYDFIRESAMSIFKSLSKHYI